MTKFAPVQITQHEPERRQRTVAVTNCGCCCCCCCLHTLGSVIGAAIAPTMGGGDSGGRHPLPPDHFYYHRYLYWEVSTGGFALETDLGGKRESLGFFGTKQEMQQAIQEHLGKRNDAMDMTESVFSREHMPRNLGAGPIDDTVPDVRIRPPNMSAVAFFWLLCVAIVFLTCFIGVFRGDPCVWFFYVLIYFPAMQLGSAAVTLIVFAAWERPDRIEQLKQLGKIGGGVVLGTVLGLVPMFVVCGGWF